MPTTTEPFAPEAPYELKIDTDGDAVADIAYRVRFALGQRGTQTAILRRIDGPQAAGTDDGGHVIIERAPVSTGWEAQVTEAGDYRFFAGWRSDPFFCDVEGTKNNLQFTSDDFFADKDVCGIALEVPNSALGSKKIRLWARTLVSHDGGRGGWVQVDRGALPAQTNVLTGDKKDAYIAARFVTVFAHSLEQQVAILRKKQDGWLARCCQIFCRMALRARRPFPSMAEHSPRMSSIPSWPSSQMERLQRIK